MNPITAENRCLCIGVIGAGQASPEAEAWAYEVGRLLARQKAVLLCGGMGGVMEAACRGAVDAGGLTLGILPGDDAALANPYVRIPIVTDMGHARNVIIAQSAQGLIAIDGENGTLSEIAIGLKLGKPVFALGCWSELPGVTRVVTAQEAVDRVLHAVRSH